MAPEVIKGEECKTTVDWWSMGVILYELLCGFPPFMDDSPKKVFDKIVNKKIEWPKIAEAPDCLSPNAYDLINKLLAIDPNRRLGKFGVEEIKRHPFFKGIDWDKVTEM